jgi:inorganic pyrophosphatase
LVHPRIESGLSRARVKNFIPPFKNHGKLVNVIIETPRGCRNKFKYDERLQFLSWELRSLRDVSDNLLNELIHFFKSYNDMKHKEFEVIAVQGPKYARKLIARSLRSDRKR